MKKLFIFLYSAYLIFNSAFSFGQEIEWQNTIGGSGSDALRCIRQTSDGGYILGGVSGSNISGDKTENYIGNGDYWIVKTDATGNIQWQNTIGGNGNDDLFSVEQTIDGGYILGGYSNSNISGDKSENSIGMSDYWIVKTDSFGIVQWQNTIGGNDYDFLSCIQQTFDGGYILEGRSSSNISGDKTENCKGDYDYWIVKTDATGSILWQKTIGGSSFDALQSLHQTSDGGYILGGTSDSNISGDKTETSNGGGDYWIVKTDATGNIQWQNTIGGNGNDYLLYVTQTFEGGYILGGYSLSGISGDKSESNFGDNDYWIIKTDLGGNIQWQNTIGGNGDDLLFSIQQAFDGGYILGGSSLSNLSGDKTQYSRGSTDFWIVKTDTLGIIQWQNTIGGSSFDGFQSIHQTSDGGYIIGGLSDSNISGDKTENSNGDLDYWIVKLTDKYNSIKGCFFADMNSNNTKDATEHALIQKKITEQNTGRFSFSELNGNYSLSVLDSGSFVVTPAISSLNYYNAVPVSHSASFTSTNQIDSLNDFAFQPTGTFNDLCITITPTSAFRSGFDASYIINYENVGTTTLNGTIKIHPDTVLSYVSSSQLPVSINADSIEWNVGTLTPFQSGTIVVTFNISSTSTIGSTCNTTVHIEPIAGDANPSCNFDTSSVLISSSYDPNDILVNEGAILTTQLPSQPWLDYTIRFQNTGNDTAFTVNVHNPIDTTKLELSSIEFVNSSHPVNLTWIPWERNMEFKFNNILLPDSNINEPMSHGFVHYRIKPKTTLQAGDSITNNAYIYFDFNAPVATNTAVTKIVLPTGISDVRFENYDLKVFPNPANDEITITGYTLQNNQPTVLKIYDVMGKEVYHSSITTLNIKLQTLNFSPGVYFVQISDGGNYIARARFVKQ